MSDFYQYFTEDEVIFIKKEFYSWMEKEANNNELTYDTLDTVYNLVRSKRIAGLQASDEMTFQAYEAFKNGY